MKKILFTGVLLALLSQFASAQIIEPRREMRATWLTTVSNLDWPKSGDRLKPLAQQESLRNMLDSLKKININAVFFQVRTECDALYQSDFEPWSRFLGGPQGTDPGYDPLAFAIEEAHKRGMELHAWLNPYRLNSNKSATDSYYHPTHPYKENPEWAIAYSDGGKILNPGLPVVQKYIKKIIGDLIGKYDVDGIHFDDYFYAYGGTSDLLDQEAYDLYKDFDGQTRGDFRRSSINKMVAEVMDTILQVRPFIRFGISPFGIYGNGMNPPGISGLDAYNTIYCDPLAWLAAGTVDYINPQLYWPTGGSQDFGTLLPWWANYAEEYNRHVYAGHGIYRLDTNAPLARTSTEDTVVDSELHESKSYFGISSTENASGRTENIWSLEQIATQVNITRQNAAKGALGGVYFRTNDFERVNGLKEHLWDGVYKDAALVPSMPWKGAATPVPPTGTQFVLNEEGSGYILSWNHPKDSMRYIIYEVETDPISQELTRKRMIDFVYGKSAVIKTVLQEGSSLAISTFDRYGNESALSEFFQAPIPAKVNLVRPVDLVTNVRSDDSLFWNVANNATSYELKLSTDVAQQLNVQTWVTTDTLFPITLLPVAGENTYYWSVKGLNFSGGGESSDVRAFTTAFPKTPVINFPSQDAQNISLTPTIQYTGSAVAVETEIQISQGGTSFNSNALVINTTVPASGNYTVNPAFQELTTYYLRLRTTNSFGKSKWSAVTSFRTLKNPPPATSITDPANLQIFPLGTSAFVVKWNASSGATSYLVEIATDANFQNLANEREVFGSTQHTFQFAEQGATYYIRVASKNIGGVSPWSPVVQVMIDEPLSVDPEKSFSLFPNPFDGVIHIQLSSESASAKWFLFNVAGNLLSSGDIENKDGQSVINANGMHCKPCILRIVTSDKTYTGKVFSKE